MYPSLLVDTLARAFKNPDKHFGSGERNTEVKVCYNLLSCLGWNPITEIAINFQIPKVKLEETAKASHAVDFAIWHDNGVGLLGEVKHWFVNNSGWLDGLEQIKRYQKAIPVQRCFLTCGYRWGILDEHGELIEDIQEKEDINRLIERLKPHLGKSLNIKPVKEADIWAYGIYPSSLKRRSKLKTSDENKPSWDPAHYDDETIAYRVRALKEFAERHNLNMDTGKTALIVRLSGKKKIIEYIPLNPEIYVAIPKQDLTELNISDKLRKEFEALSVRLRKGQEGFSALLDMLERVVIFYRKSG